METLQEGDKVKRLSCLHVFHAKELDEWLNANKLWSVGFTRSLLHSAQWRANVDACTSLISCLPSSMLAHVFSSPICRVPALA